MIVDTTPTTKYSSGLPIFLPDLKNRKIKMNINISSNSQLPDSKRIINISFASLICKNETKLEVTKINQTHF